MLNFNKKEYIQSIKTLHPADQADSIENLSLKDQTTVLKSSQSTFILILLLILEMQQENKY
jgi:hypothetical protein